MKRITYISGGKDGHHGEYDRLFMAVFQEMCIPVDCVQDACQVKNDRDLLFYSMFDSKPAKTFPALIRTLARSILGRKTVGLFFRPAECLHATTLMHKTKKMLFRLTAHLPRVSILTILPFDLCPEFSQIATNGIYDPQLWDLHYLGMPSGSSPELERRIASAARGRRILVALGGQNISKGFDYLADLWCSSPNLRDAFLFVVAGKVSAGSLDKARRFAQADGLLVDRFIDNNELFALYKSAGIVWSCYSPRYNQASGIHGRAVQLGVPVVVREGSYLEKLGEKIGHATLAIRFDDPQQAADKLLAWQPSPDNGENPAGVISNMREHSLAVLAEAIR